MIQAERLETIQNLSDTNDIVTWDYLESLLNVSRSTLRRDVSELESAGVLKKTTGGFIFNQKAHRSEPSYRIRQVSHTDEKIRIAKAGIDFIADNSFIMLDSGTTIMELAKRIPETLNLNVISYDYQSIACLEGKDNITSYLAGGVVRKGFSACHGHFAEQMMASFHANTCFLGADGVTASFGISGFNSYDIHLKQIMIERSEQVVLLADHSKFDKNAFALVASAKDIDVIITDKKVSEDQVRALRDLGVKVVIV